MSAVDISIAGAQNSIPTILQSLSRCAYSFFWTGTAPVGTITIQVSNDYSLNANGSVANAGNWATVGGVSGSVSGASGVGGIDIITGFYAIRAVYTRTSGTGSLTAYINAKVS